MTEATRSNDAVPPPIDAHRSQRTRIPLVWIIPAVAALIGGWLAFHAYSDHGPTITVTFLDAEGLEAGKTKVRYESVDIGEVRSIVLAPDRHTVTVTIETAKFAAPFLVSGTRFWIVRPRLGASGVSGLGTLLSGAFIAMDVGKAKDEARSFAGLERPPVVAGDAKGRQFILSAADLGSLAVSSPVYFRRVQVGQVSAVDLNKDGHGVTLKLFIDAPYDRFVTVDTRFWHASGIDVQVDSGGVHVQSQSLTAILAGGVAFETPADSAAPMTAADDERFTLAANQAAAMKRADGAPETFVLYFDESLRGLAPGAIVDFRGVDIGEVVALNVAYRRATQTFEFPVMVHIYPERLWSRYAKDGERPVAQSHALVAQMIKQGFRAQLRTASLLTGQLYVALDFFPRAPRIAALPDLEPMPLPTLPGNLEQVQASLMNVVHKLDQLPLGQIAHDVDVTLVSLNHMLGAVDADVVPEAKSTLAQARQTLQQTQQTLAPEAALQGDLHSTLSSVSRAADSVRNLADYLDRHPEALIRGKAEESR